MRFVRRRGGWLSRLRHVFISDDVLVRHEEPWRFRVSEGEYEWTVSFHAPDDPWNPTTLYAYKARNPKTGWEGYIVAFYPEGCPESACAHYFRTEATDEDILTLLEDMAWVVSSYYYSDLERFYDELSDLDVYELDSSELERYEFIRPTPDLAERLARRIREELGVAVKRIPLFRRERVQG